MNKRFMTRSCVLCEDSISITPFERNQKLKEWLVVRNRFDDFIYICPCCRNFYSSLTELREKEKQLKYILTLLSNHQEELFKVCPLILTYRNEPLSIGNKKPKFYTIQLGEKLDEVIGKLMILTKDFSDRIRDFDYQEKLEELYWNPNALEEE